MDVVSVSLLRTASVLWQAWPGAWRLTVVAKLTCVLAPGESSLAEEQEYPNEDDNYWNDDPKRSLYSPNDLAPVKQRGDVTLVGHAFAPRGEPVRSLVARLIIGDVDKSIEVYGERAWTQDGALREGPRFVKMPLRYERAAGGPGSPNPVGMAVDARPDVYGNVPLPNLQQTGLLVTEPSDFIEVIGFGPIAPTWPLRSEKLGSHSATWSHSGWHSKPMPQDIDPGYWNAAPRDQQVATLRDNERIVLENLHPEVPRLVTSLPGVRPRAFVERGGVVQDLPMVCDTLWIDTDRSICTLTWRGTVVCESATESGRVVVGMESGAQRITWADLQGEDREDTGTAPGLLVLEPAPAPSGRGALGALSAPAPIAAPGLIRPTLPTAPASTADASDLALRRRRNQTINTVSGLSAAQNPLTNALPFLARAEPGPARAAPVTDAPGPNDAMPAWLQRTRGAAPAAPPSHPSDLQVAPPPAPPPQHSGLIPAPMAAPMPAPSPMSAPSSDSPWAGGSPRSSGDGGGPSPGLMAPLPAPAASPPSNASGSAIAASNAAIAASSVWNVPPPTTPAAESPPVVRSAPRTPRDVVDLIWFDPESVAPIRATERWKNILAELHPNKPRDTGFDFDDPPEEKAEKPVEDRRDVFGVLMRGDTTDTEGVNEAIADAVTDDGTFTPPLVLLAGELQFPFDELETLKATVTAVTPLIAGDKKLKETVDTVNELLKTPWLQSSTGVAEGLTARVKEAFSQGNRMLPASYLDSHTDRILLEQRHYQKRTVFGEVWIRTLLAMPGSSATIPTYLPEALSKKLPMFQAMRVRMIAEAHAQQDQYEAHPTALRVVAFGRLIVTSRR